VTQIDRPFVGLEGAGDPLFAQKAEKRGDVKTYR
jgi:hypothetical protein